VTGGENTIFMNQSITGGTQAYTGVKGALKAKPRDFNAETKLLEELGAKEYDRLPDLAELKISLESKILTLMDKWKCFGGEKLKLMPTCTSLRNQKDEHEDFEPPPIEKRRFQYLIRREVIMELTAIEERKKTRIDRAEAIRKRREQEEAAEQEHEETLDLKKSQAGSPSKLQVGFMDRSSVSSPTKASPKKSYAMTGGSETDVMSMSMASKASPSRGGSLVQKMFGAAN